MRATATMKKIMVNGSRPDDTIELSVAVCNLINKTSRTKYTLARDNVAVINVTVEVIGAEVETESTVELSFVSILEEINIFLFKKRSILTCCNHKN